jgi:hypothetical protein
MAGTRTRRLGASMTGRRSRRGGAGRCLVRGKNDGSEIGCEDGKEV